MKSFIPLLLIAALSLVSLPSCVTALGNAHRAQVHPGTLMIGSELIPYDNKIYVLGRVKYFYQGRLVAVFTRRNTARISQAFQIK